MAKEAASTTKMDLATDANINGVQYTAGKDVEVPSEHVQALKEIGADNGRAVEFARTHHGAVPAPSHPLEATAQTPTRPLGAPEVREAVVTAPADENRDLFVVDDKGQVKPVADQAAAIAEGKKVEDGKVFDDSETVNPVTLQKD